MMKFKWYNQHLGIDKKNAVPLSGAIFRDESIEKVIVFSNKYIRSCLLLSLVRYGLWLLEYHEAMSMCITCVQHINDRLTISFMAIQLLDIW